MSWLKVECRVNLFEKHYKQIQNIRNLRSMNNTRVGCARSKARKAAVSLHENTDTLEIFS